MSDAEIGIEQARAVLGDLADQAADGYTTYLTRRGRRVAAIVSLERVMPITDYTAYLVRGEQPFANSNGVDLAGSALENRPDVLAWAEENGLSADDPDVWIMVAPAGRPVETADLIATQDFPAEMPGD